jgi:hypothetical protein
LRSGLALNALFGEAVKAKRLVGGKVSAFEKLFKNAPAVVENAEKRKEIDPPAPPAKRESNNTVDRASKRRNKGKKVETPPVEVVKPVLKKKGGQKSMFDFMKKKSDVVSTVEAELPVAVVVEVAEECIDLTGEGVGEEASVNMETAEVIELIDEPVIEVVTEEPLIIKVAIDSAESNAKNQEVGDKMDLTDPIDVEEAILECIDLTMGVEEESPVVIDKSLVDSCTDDFGKGKERARAGSPSVSSKTKPSSAQKTLVVIEECDILFSQDKGFWPAIHSILSSSKSPVIFTANGMLNYFNR